MSNIQQIDNTYIAHTYARFPVHLVKGKGSLVWDENGKETITEEDVTKGSLMKEGDKLRWTDSKIEEDGLFVKVSE